MGSHTNIQWILFQTTFEMQLYAMPVYDMIESVLVKNFKLKPTFLLRLIARSAYVGESIVYNCASISCYNN